MHHIRCSVLLPIHVEFAEAEQVSVVEVEEKSSVGGRQDVEGAGEGAKDQNVQQEEDCGHLDNSKQHVHEEACLAEDSQEVEDFEPHSKGSERLDGVLELVEKRVIFSGEQVGEHNQDDEERGHEVGVVPKVL